MKRSLSVLTLVMLIVALVGPPVAAKPGKSGKPDRNVRTGSGPGSTLGATMSHWEIAFLVTALGIGLAAVSFWAWMLVDCWRHETTRDQNRLAWLLVILFLKLIGATVYYFARFRPRRLGPANG